MQKFEELCKKYGLEYYYDDDAPIEISMIIPSQKWLKYECWLCLQNDDELWFSIDGCSFNMFPAEKYWEDYLLWVEDVFTGKMRLKKFYKMCPEKPFKHHFEKFETNEWVKCYGGGFLNWLPFLKTRTDIVQVEKCPIL